MFVADLKSAQSGFESQWGHSAIDAEDLARQAAYGDDAIEDDASEQL